MVTIVGVSRPRTSGSVLTKAGKKAYRGKRRHWYIYFYDDEGRFRKRQIGAASVPYYGSLIRRRKMYLCGSCRTKFRAMKDACPKCGARASRLKKEPKAPPLRHT
jgi:rubrerythrin